MYTAIRIKLWLYLLRFLKLSKNWIRPFNKLTPRILQIGTAPNKNIERLIEALKGTKCVLIIIGRHNPLYEARLKGCWYQCINIYRGCQILK